MDGVPSHGRSLLRVRGVVTRRVKDRDAYVPIWVDVGVPDVGNELHLGRMVGVILWELELAVENASLTVLQKTSLAGCGLSLEIEDPLGYTHSQHRLSQVLAKL